MVRFTHVVADPLGMHARLVARVCAAARAQRAEAVISCNGQTARADNLLELMALDASEGDVLEVMVEGPDERAAAEALRAVLL